VLTKIGDNVWDYNFDTQTTTCSNSASLFFGHSLGANTDAFVAWRKAVYAEDKQLLAQNDEAVKQGHKNHYAVEYRISHSDGSIHWLLERGVIIEKNADGLPVKMVGTHTDITDVKRTKAALAESEKRWQLAMEGTGDGVWDWNMKDNTVTSTTRWKLRMGYESDEATEPLSNWLERIHPEDLSKREENYQRYLAGEVSVYHSEHRLRYADGNYKWVLSRGMILEWDRQNNPVRMIGVHTDIDEAKQTEAALEKRVKQFQALSENIPGVIFEYESKADGSHIYRYISPAMDKIFGIKPSSVFKLTQFIHPEDLAEMENDLEKAAVTMAPFYNECRLIIPGRGIIWRSMSCSFSYFSEEGGKVFTGLLLDISERKKADEKLSESENRLSSLISNLQTGILVEDENGQIILTNELFCKMFELNMQPDELKRYDIAELTEMNSRFFGDDDFYKERIGNLVEFKQLAMDELLELNDGRIFSRDFIPIYSKGIYKGNLWKFTDVTDVKNAEKNLRMSEEKYRSIIANMNLGLLEVDTDEKIVFANQSFCEMCGYELDEIIGQRAAQLFIKGESIEIMERKNEERRKLNADAYEIVVKNKRGQVRWWLVSGAPRYNESGDLVGTIGIHLDITAQKELEYELTIAREQAEASTRSKEVFLANMSHEIRTPMNAILGMGNQLSKTPLNGKQQFYLDTINSASENLLVIINDILDLSKIEAGKLSLERIAFEPQAVIKRAMQVLLHRAEEKGLTLTNSFFDDQVHGVLMGDPYRLNQVLLNIISNAIKFTERGGVDIMVNMLQDTRESQLLRVCVADTGIGMEDYFVKNLFEKFSQEDASVTRQFGGTGLGMSICKELLELMGGKIKATSKKGFGTTICFEVRFPKGNAVDLPSKEVFVAKERMLAGKKILVVDDNEMNRLVAATILNNFGALTEEAGNGKEAVDFLMTNTVDLVLMDVQMPVMNGFEATGVIRRAISPTLPVIALTANAIKGDEDKCIEAGMTDYMSKPFKEEDLLKKIANLILDTMPVTTIVEPEKPQAPISYYDLSEIRNISRGNEEFVKKMLRMFVEQTPGHISEMKLKYKAKELNGLGEIAHRIKPTIDNMGIVSLKATIREIEKIGKSGADNEALPALMEKVENDIEVAIAAIKTDFQLA
jgi:PAS domain S-box-containing protein